MWDPQTKSFLFKIFCIIIAFSPHVESFSRGSRKRIYNGFNAEHYEFNYHVSIQVNGGHLCGGAIIADQFVLTAAHCFFRQGEVDIYDGPLTVKSGTNRLSESGIVIEIDKIMVHLDYMNKYSYENHHIMDIAVVKLKERLYLDGYRLQKINLPDKTMSGPSEGETVTIVGYGLTEDAYMNFDGLQMQIDGSTSMVLKSLQTLVVDPVSCQNYQPVEINDTHMCTYLPRDDDDQDRYGECYGDSGGPLAYNNTVVGVVSSGPPFCGDRNAPTIYTRVSSYLDFISNALNVLPNGDMVIYKKSDDDGQFHWS